MRFTGLFMVFAVITSITAYSQQTGAVTGSVSDATDSKPLKSATVVLLDATGKTRGGSVSDGRGRFVIGNISAGNYNLNVRYIGYDTLRKSVIITAADTLQLGTLLLKASSLLTDGVEVTGNAIRMEIKGDTAEYNAKQFKTDKNAVAEDMIRKMPGIEVDQNGQVKAQGEQVRRILVDGKPFFGSDPTAALKNLPSEVIDKIQVYDQMSDQSAFTRFDDGDRTKTLNIVMRQDRKRGQFGKLYAGYGTDNRYSAGGNINLFNGDQRISLIGMSNNINQQNFSIQDILGAVGGGNDPMRQRMGTMMQAFGGGGRMSGGMGRMYGGGGRDGGSGAGVGDFLVQQSDGITAAHSLGINYSDTWAKNLAFTGSYFVNLTDNESDQNTNRLYFLTGNTTQINIKKNNGDTRNLNHRFNLRFDYTLDSLNSFSLTPRLTFQSTDKNITSLDSTLTSENTTLNTSDVRTESNTKGINFNNELLYRRKFLTDGRTFSITFRTGYNDNTGDGTTTAYNQFLQQNALQSDSLLQQIPSDGKGLTLGANASYTEPLFENSILQLSYNVSYNRNTATRKTFLLDTLSTEFNRMDTILSNESESRYTTHRPGVNIRYNFNPTTNLSIGADYQIAELAVQQIFPQPFDVTRTFTNVLPSLSFTMRPNMMSNVRVNYRTSTDQPSISQLQNVVDNSDPVRLSVGNSNLKQEFTHSLSANYGTFNMTSASAFFVMASVRNTFDRITTSTIIATQDTLLPDGNIRLKSGAQLTRQINLDGYWSANTFATYSFPVEPLDSIKLNLSVNAGAMFTRTPTLVNGAENIADNLVLTPSLAVTSNINENLDFSLSWRTAYTIVGNSLRTELNDNYYTHTFYGRLNWVFWGGFVLSGDMSYIINGGLSGGYNQNIPLLSAGIGYRLLDGDAEIKLSVFDVLKQNQSVVRNISGNYIEDIRTAVLQRYGLLTFTYNLRRFVQ